MPPLAGFDLAALQAALTAMGADGWLLFDFRGVNPIATRVLDVHGMGTRRFFVLLPRSGSPVAVAHKIELTSFDGFPGEVRAYAAWKELHAALQPLVRGRTLAMEVSPADAVPYLDRVPHGVVQLLESFGAQIVTSAPLVTQFAARWSAAELAGHRKAAEAIAAVARESLVWAGAELARGAVVRETTLQQHVLEGFARAGVVTDHPPIAAFGPNAANPHYEPQAGSDRTLAPGEVLLLDLWAGPTRGTVFADQTWMACAKGTSGAAPDAEVLKVWTVVRDARDAAVARLKQRWGKTGKDGEAGAVTGAELDDAAREVISRAGYGEWFVHRTGHSIDRELHGSGPHLDNFETADTRALQAGIGFSVEPGVYLTGRFGVRSEINVYLGATGPEVTPSVPQQDLFVV
ncbi:MAG TPA: M24 family metallopeptidase [Gemmatimonadales bacterium]|jgi:Xaa-Pro aminopeptidase|nr:M24 family metallopeptidase [Gemmatimonadales bacterium]